MTATEKQIAEEISQLKGAVASVRLAVTFMAARLEEPDCRALVDLLEAQQVAVKAVPPTKPTQADARHFAAASKTLASHIRVYAAPH